MKRTRHDHALAARRTPLSLLLLLTVAVGLACGDGDASDDGTASAPPAAPAAAPRRAIPPPPETAPPAEAAPAPKPSGAVSPSSPYPCIPGQVEAGRARYQTFCASCHGARGAGDGPAAQGLDPQPARHDDGPYMNALSNEYLRRVIAEGGAAVGKSPLMAPWGQALGEQGVHDVTAFVRSLATPPYACPL